jgi:hypothetical protein
VTVLGARCTPWSDVYHELLRAPWWLYLAGLAALFLPINLVFAFGHRAVGGVGG